MIILYNDLHGGQLLGKAVSIAVTECNGIKNKHAPNIKLEQDISHFFDCVINI